MDNDTVIASLKEKIDDLNQQAWEARVKDSTKAFQLSEESVTLARSIHYPRGLAEGLRSLGFGYIRLFKNDEAAPLLRESLSLFQSLNDINGQGIVYEYLGIIERNWGNLGASLELLLKGYALIQQLGSLETEATCCYQIGVTYKHLGDHESALDYLYQALSLAKKIDFALIVAYATNIIGSIYFDSGEYNHALDCYQQGLVIRRESNDKWGEAGSLDNIGFTYLKLNDLGKAIDYCNQSLAISQSTDDKKGEANALLHLAEIYQQAGDVNQASKFSNESLEIRKERGDKRGEAEVLLFLADLHKNRSDVEGHQIFEWLSGALKIADEIKAQDVLSKAYYNLHEYTRQKGNFKESLIQLEAHLQIEKEVHKNTINQKVANLEISHKAEAISQRNKELTELNEKIEKANEELKVEASLERVRAVAMGMKEPRDMINVCRMISDQLQQLGFKEIRNVQTVIIYPQKHEYLNYQYFTPYDKASIETIDYRLHPDVLDFTNQMLASADAYYTKTFEGKELEAWREYRKQTNQLPDPKLDASSSSHYYFYSIGSGALGVTTYAPLSDQQIDLFKRFRNVFELAYRRFIDIEKALAQAREAQIEAALERVRAKSMAMHHSDDLITVINIVQEQLLGLGFHFHAANFVTDYSEKGYTMWLASPGESFPYKIYVPQIGLKYFEAVNAAIEKGSDFATYTLSFEEKNTYFKNLFENTLAKNTSEEGKRVVYESKGMAASVVLLDKVRLNLMNLDLTPYTEDENSILKRFGYAFEQSYTRFLDLQKAEGQAREGQIQLALERVRARTMAMHHSDELAEVATVLFEQMSVLDNTPERFNIRIINEAERAFEFWATDQEGRLVNKFFKAEFDKSPVVLQMYHSWKAKEKILIQDLYGDQLSQWVYYIKDVLGVPFNTEHLKEHRFLSSIFFSHGMIGITTNDTPKHETLTLIERFAKVFEQTYTRFLDLQKAEAQAREAQIETALEKVRSHTMGMRSSEDLANVATVMFDQMRVLGGDLFSFGIVLCDKHENIVEQWHSIPHAGMMAPFFVPVDLDYIHRYRYDQWKAGVELFSVVIPEDYIAQHFGLMLELPSVKAVWEGIAAKGIPLPPIPTWEIDYGASFKYGYLLVSALKPFEETKIFPRFAKVFEQAYTRFLDLQKAEAQAREAQIETGLERVRSKTMAMHKSEEVTGVAVSLNEELLKLGFEGGSTIIIINQETGDTEQWTGFSEDKSIKSCYVPYFKHPYHDAMFNAWKKGETFLVYTLAGDEKRSIDDHYFTTGYKIFPENDKKWMREMESVTFSHAFMKYGAIHWGPDHLTEEQLRILQRFSKVFEQSYTRFLDLQKAEGQAREAQIETALERVRSRTMGMQRSGELPEAANLLFQQIQSLGVPVFSTGYNIWDDDKKTVTSWMSSEGIIQLPFKLPLTEETSLRECYNAAQQGDTFFVQELSGEKLLSHLNYMSTLPVVGQLMKKMGEAGISLPRYMINHHAFFSHGYLLFITYAPVPEAHEIFKRFAKVFEQTYTRFLDLQKAEAQAREAQIEAALERVRGRAMAMHTSTELKEVAKELRKQIGLLGTRELVTCAINLYEESAENVYAWAATRPPQSQDEIIEFDFSFPKKGIVIIEEVMQVYSSGAEEYVVINEGAKGTQWMNVLKEARPDIFSIVAYSRNDKTTDIRVWWSCAFFPGGSLIMITKSTPDEASRSLLKRFAQVFGLAYRRFADLRKAEAQAREAQIEAALERVRAKVMAMTSSNELNATSLVFGEQLRKLGIDWQFSYFWLVDESKDENVFWITWPDYKTSFTTYTLKEAEEYFNDCLISWRAGVKIHDNYVPPEGVQEWLDTFQRIADDAGGEAKKVMVPQTFPNGVFYYDAMMKYGSFGICISKPATDEEKKIQCRFAIEFERAYTRFLDLKQAEAQAREAQIELGLERVRARAMAMQKSDELVELIDTLQKELTKLEFALNNCIFWIMDEEPPSAIWWVAPVNKTSLPESYRVPFPNQIYFNSVFKAWKDRISKWVYELTSQDKKDADRYLFTETDLIRFPDDVKKAFREVDKVYISFSFYNYGGLHISTKEPLTEEQLEIVNRFSKVFDMTYTRFLDLKKAEAQARESQIELGLERVRARAMAMQKSDELKDLISTVSGELGKLDLVLDRCFIVTYDLKTMGSIWWMSHPESPAEPVGLFVKYHEHPPYLAHIDAWRERKIKWQYILEGETKKTWDGFLFVETELSQLPDFVIVNMRGNEKVYLSSSFNNFGYLTLATLEPLSDEQFDIMVRFAKVFDLTYTRFNDLKQAEAQAREAKIEAALERVRSKAMAMHKSEDLNPAVATVFEELEKLDIGILRCGIAIMDKEKPRADVWITVKSEQTNTIQVSGDEPLDYHPLLRGAYDGWIKQEDFSYVLQGEDLLSYYRDVASIKYQLPVSTPFDKEKTDQQQYYFNAVFQDGSLFAFLEMAITDEAKSVMKRFANVFNLTYKRFLDLQKAEAQTREALIEGALERVRARALAMQQPEELKEVAEVLRIEMGLLGIEELETCSIYINDVSTEKAECWYALKDIRLEEKKLVNDHFALNLNDTWVGRQMLSFYDSNEKQTSIVMQGENRKEWIRYCEEKSAPFRGYYGEVIPDRTYHLYKFSHGAIGAASAGDISAESWRLLSRAASVFSLAYSRFKDLTQARIDLVRLKEEKQRAEDALSDLQATQKQLIQSEKMASLGELTAGIAHEIQNPLNFVNNFSDVSSELLEEMKSELAIGNAQQAIEIVNNVKENLDKILHHGKRADAIVKSMLQHSRSSAGKKEPTDINSLAEEYFRLAFHGLRAKDKSFNAKFETNLDNSIGKINIISQDVGRVILNLINNAFYAVNEKKNKNGNGYEPMVTIATKKLDDRVEIKVKDNGDGIPQKVLDKIFQPFFTTKPTGQGTGLGLSLSYDIITKGHGGELLVKTKEGEGSEFIISLPVN